jgi:hypothetical protein
MMQGVTENLRTTVEIVNLVLTFPEGPEILVWLLVAFLHDREVLFFDNRYDVPESVRNHLTFRALNGLSKSSDIILLGRLPGMRIPGFFFAKRPDSNESLILAQNERWRRA